MFLSPPHLLHPSTTTFLLPHLSLNPNLHLLKPHRKPPPFSSLPHHTSSLPLLAQLTDSPLPDDGPVELPFTFPSFISTDDNPSTLQVATSLLLTGAISVFLFRSLRRRAKRAKQLLVLRSVTSVMGWAIRGLLGDGQGVFFWLDSWATETPLASMFPDLFLLEKNKSALVADRVSVPGNGWVWGWRRSQFSAVEQAQFAQLCALVSVPVLSGEQDKWTWRLENSGLFSVGSLKRRLQSTRFSRPSFIVKNNSWVPKKANILAWRAELDRLPTKSALARRNIHFGADLCHFCGDFAETTEHIFVSCGFSQTLWTLVAQWCNVSTPFIFHFKDLLELHDHIGGSGKKKKAFYAIVLTTIWCIWKHRNEAVFNQQQVSIQRVIGDIKSLSMFWVKARSNNPLLDWNSWRSFNVSRIGCNLGLLELRRHLKRRRSTV